MEPTAPPRTVPPSHTPKAGHPHPIRAVLVVVLLLAAGLAAAYAVSEGVDPVYRMARNRYRQAVAAGPTVQALSLGNSHGRAINFEALGLRGATLRNAGGDYYEALHYTRSVREHLPNLEYVFVTLSLFANDNGTDAARSEVRKQAYVATGNYRAVAGDRRLALEARIAPIVRTDNWEGVFAKVAGRLASGLPSARAARRGQRRRPTRTADDIRRSAVRKAALHHDWEAYSLARNPSLCEEAREALREIARLSAPARIVLYTPPYPPTYLSHRDTTGGCHLDRFAAALAASSPRVTYFDDRALASFTDGSGLFRDGDHVNPAGARAYSALLAERLGLR